jgi:hypothetical protein
LFFETPSKVAPLTTTPSRGTWVFFHHPGTTHWDTANVLLRRGAEYVIASDLDDDASYRWRAVVDRGRYRLDCARAEWEHVDGKEPNINWYRDNHVVNFFRDALDVTLRGLGIQPNAAFTPAALEWFWQRSSASACEELLLRGFATLLQDTDPSNACVLIGLVCA